MIVIISVFALYKHAVKAPEDDYHLNNDNENWEFYVKSSDSTDC